MAFETDGERTGIERYRDDASRVQIDWDALRGRHHPSDAPGMGFDFTLTPKAAPATYKAHFEDPAGEPATSTIKRLDNRIEWDFAGQVETYDKVDGPRAG